MRVISDLSRTTRFVRSVWLIPGLVQRHQHNAATLPDGLATNLWRALLKPGMDAAHAASHQQGKFRILHGWTLGWFGIATMVGAIVILRGNMTAIRVTGMIGGLAELGCLLFVDCPDYVNFVPGTVMAFVSGSAFGSGCQTVNPCGC